MMHSTSTTPPGFAELQRSEFSRVFGLVLAVRLFAAPIGAAVVLTLALWEGVPWRWVVLGGTAVGILSLSWLEVRRFRREGMRQYAVELNLLAMVVGQLVVTFGTGGLESPFMPVMLVLVLVWALTVSGRPWYDAVTLAVQLAAPWLFAWVARAEVLPDFNLRLVGGGPRGGHDDVHLALSATVLNVGTLISRRLGRALRGVFDGMLLRAMAAGEDLRREHAERAQSLVALTGEIAHELKNPLASVKGLATLLVQNVDGAKGAERLGVLRREVDRMQEILEEFLGFSRPLLPLALEPAALGALCQQVADLHEGVARERGVALTVRGQASARCDVRKVRQVLINLVQNALDATPRGGEVVLAVEAGPSLATVRVLDRGTGLDPAVLPRLFEPGVTSKPKGNGLGLTLARALARQHGGELTLSARDGGGCQAVLTLPAVVLS